VFLTKPRQLACEALSENIANEWPLCSASTEQSDKSAAGQSSGECVKPPIGTESYTAALPAGGSQSPGPEPNSTTNQKARITAVRGRRPRPREGRSYALAVVNFRVAGALT
jgi:hypothetical protein